MAYFPADMPGPVPTLDDAAFWDHCAERRLRFQSCAACEQPRHPPTPICARCGSTRLQWVEAPDHATVFTFTVVHHASHPAVIGHLPYVVAVVDFPQLPPVRLVTNVTDVDPAQMCVGLPVRLWWDRLADADAAARPMYLPRFRPA
jgi:uncharacterized OB-fold protein